MEQEHFSNLFYLLHESGDKLYPQRMKDRKTGDFAFRVSPGGRGSNTKEVEIEVGDEQKMKWYVFERGYAVRASTKNGNRKGLYKIEGHSIVQAVECD